MAFALMAGRTQVKYDAVWTSLKTTYRGLTNQDLSSTRVVSDYEQAMCNAVRTAFPNATLQGCFFHLSQAIIRKVKAVGLGAQYRRDRRLKLVIKKIIAVAYLPIRHVNAN